MDTLCREAEKIVVRTDDPQSEISRLIASLTPGNSPTLGPYHEVKHVRLFNDIISSSVELRVYKPFDNELPIGMAVLDYQYKDGELRVDFIRVCTGKDPHSIIKKLFENAFLNDRSFDGVERVIQYFAKSTRHGMDYEISGVVIVPGCGELVTERRIRIDTSVVNSLAKYLSKGDKYFERQYLLSLWGWLPKLLGIADCIEPFEKQVIVHRIRFEHFPDKPELSSFDVVKLYRIDTRKVGKILNMRRTAENIIETAVSS